MPKNQIKARKCERRAGEKVELEQASCAESSPPASDDLPVHDVTIIADFTTRDERKRSIGWLVAI